MAHRHGNEQSYPCRRRQCGPGLLHLDGVPQTARKRWHWPLWSGAKGHAGASDRAAALLLGSGRQRAGLRLGRVGPALESYSSYQSVRRLDGSEFTVGEFLKEVRRLVADFALGQILKGRSTEGLDEWTRYYLIHRANFGLEGAPVGECILLSQGYGLDLNDLRAPRGYIVKLSGSDIRLARWDERGRADPSTGSGRGLGEAHPSGGLPQIDMLHKLMHLWAAGNLDALNAYADQNGLRQNDLFWAVAQAILEMAEAKSRERTLLEAIVAWGRGKVPETQVTRQGRLL